MNRRFFFGLLVGLTGAGSVRKLIPRRRPSMGYTIYECPSGKVLFRAEFKYYIRPQPPVFDRIILHKRHEIEKQS